MKQSACEFLYSLQSSGIKLGLSNMEKLCEAMGHPERRARFVHIAGTNGKGSTAAFVERILREAGYRTGLFTSPHLLDFRERIQVNGSLIPQVELEAGVERLREMAARLGPGVEPTFFEATTALAFEYFASQGVDIVVLEVGMGGRLDSTNVIVPECAAITSIGMDHTQWLGGTLKEIAFEKAGILKRGRPAVLGPIEGQALEEIQTVAYSLGVQLRLAAPADSQEWNLESRKWTFVRKGVAYEFATAAVYQISNACVALEVVEALRDRGFTILPDAQRKGLEFARWPGRFDIFRWEPPLIVDGGHNSEGLMAAKNAWEKAIVKSPQRVIFGCLKDKPFRQMARVLDDWVEEVWLVPLLSERSLTPALIGDCFSRARVRIFNSATEAFHEELQWPASALVIGSLYLAGEAVGLLGSKSVLPCSNLVKLRSKIK